MKPFSLLLFLSVWISLSVQAQEKKHPSFEEIISLPSVYNVQLSPDGKHVLYQVGSTDWKHNRFDSELWLAKEGETPFQLTNNPKNSSTAPKWSPDGQWISFISKRGDKNQIHALRLAGGEAFPITNTKSNIMGYEWAPDGKSIAFLQAEDKTKENKKRKEKYGSFAEDDAEYSRVQLWQIAFEPFRFAHAPLPQQLADSAYKASIAPKRLLDSVEFSINSFLWSPDGKKIAIEHQPNPLINTFFKADISLYDIETKELKPLIHNPSYDGLIAWSPDGKSLLYQSHLDNSNSNYYKNDNLFKIDLDGLSSVKLAVDFDENIYRLQWTPQGIFGVAWQKTVRPLVHIDPHTGKTTILSTQPTRITAISFSKDGKKFACMGDNDTELREVYLSDYPLDKPKAITHFTKHIEKWAVAQSEVISWPSKDGQTIEGVLHKPQDYDPAKKYPLLVIIHGGPTGISTPSPTPSYVYPMVQWLNKGALILRPNYRGSAGYGEKFRSLNVRNLGVGDAWDVLSGVDYLADKDMIDSDKVGCMGWSQGGYISAFLTTNSKQFQAISVGAGISNWMTYYVNTDIHPFTRQYLEATPWSDKEIYEKTSPMTNINQASTPTLIQHGEFDRRVPVANAYELLQGLQDVGVESRLIIYKGFGHGISKPKERLAATWHNWQWFGKYIWGEEIELPEE